MILVPPDNQDLKPKKAFAPLLFLSFLTSAGIVRAAPEQADINRKFVICYNWYSNIDGTYWGILDLRIRMSMAEM